MNNTITQIVRLRQLVAILGQKSFGGWWGCDFMTEVGIDALDFNFPRRPALAAFTSTCLAAKRLHDERIGRTSVTHLFRLRADEEILVQRASAGKDAPAPPNTTDRATLLQELLKLAENESGQMKEGPIQVGEIDEAVTAKGVAAMARLYHAAFTSGSRVFPYFASKPA